MMRRGLFFLSLAAVIYFVIALVWFYLPPNGKTLLPIEDRNGRWGFVNEKGRVVVEPYLREIYDWNNNQTFLVTVISEETGDEERWGMLDRYGNQVLPFEWNEIKPFDVDGFAAPKQ